MNIVLKRCLWELSCTTLGVGGERRAGESRRHFLGGDWKRQAASGEERPGGPTLWSGKSDRRDDSPVHHAAARLL